MQRATRAFLSEFGTRAATPDEKPFLLEERIPKARSGRAVGARDCFTEYGGRSVIRTVQFGDLLLDQPPFPEPGEDHPPFAAAHEARQTPRWRCKSCGRTFTAKHGTPNHQLRSSPAHFDRAVQMGVEGVSQSATARTQGISPATVRRWLERAARHAQAFFDVLTCNVEPEDLQADEVRG